MTCRTGRQPVREFTRNKTTQVSVLFRLEAGECDHYTKGPVGGGGQCGGPDGMLLLRRHRLQRSPALTHTKNPQSWSQTTVLGVPRRWGLLAMSAAMADVVLPLATK